MKVELTLYAILLGFVMVVTLAIYGGTQLYYRSDRQQQLEDYRYIINDQKIKIAHLRDLNDYTAAMENLLNPLQLAELKALTLMINQKRQKEYERIEKPIINGKG